MGTEFPRSPKLLKGALVVFASQKPGPPPTLIVFQYNPEQLSRSLTNRAAPPNSNVGSAWEDSFRVLGSPVSPVVDFDTWSTSTGVSKNEVLEGFKAPRKACCRGFVGCPCDCKGGETVLRMGMGEDPLGNLSACAGAGLAFLTMSCPSPCGMAGTACSVLSRRANP